MKRPGQIHQKLKMAKFRHTKKELSNLLAQSYRNCKFGSPGGCQKDNLPCSMSEDRGMTCGNFAPKHTKESVQSSLKNFFDTSPVADIAIRYPDVALLKWVLEDEPEESYNEEQLKEMRSLIGFDRLEAEIQSMLKDSEERIQAVNKLSQDRETLRATLVAQQKELADAKALVSSCTEEIVNCKIDCNRLQDENDYLKQKLQDKVNLHPVKLSVWDKIKSWLS